MDKNTITKIVAWSFYDWASSAYPIIITTFIFATYFTTQVAADKISGTYQWANATAFAGFVVAITSPIFGAIADHKGHHKRWLFVFTLICAFFTGLLWFVYPIVSSVNFALNCFIISSICLTIAIVFYNSFLPHLVPKNYIGRISGWSWGAGYIGGIVSLSFVLFVLIKNPPSWIDTTTAEQIRICGPLVAVWILLFSVPFFIFVPETTSTGLTTQQAIKTGLSELLKTIKSLPKQKNLGLFLLACMIYSDGLNTLFAFGGIYAAGTFGMSLPDIILFGISINLSAGLGAILFAWINDYIGSKHTILISLACLILFGIPLILVKEIYLFWILALLLCVFVGPVQAASRSLMAHIAPPNKSTEMFGLYAFSGRVTAFMGPWLLGLSTYYFESQRAGIGTILLFFAVGGILMLFVKESKLE